MVRALLIVFFCAAFMHCNAQDEVVEAPAVSEVPEEVLPVESLENDTSPPTTLPAPPPSSPQAFCFQPNEIWSQCGTQCEPTCDNPVPGCPRFPCPWITFGGCTCLIGYVRNPLTNQCIKQNQCPVPQCPGVGEARIGCGILCEGTCATPWTPAGCTSANCPGKFCACDITKNYVRCPKTLKCIKKWNCIPLGGGKYTC